MKAIRVHQFGEPDVMKLEEVPTPAPGAKQVLVRIRAAGVNPVDTYFRSGKYPVTAPLPYIPGSDAAGEIEAVGADVKPWKKGDRVYIGGTAEGNSFGAYADHAICNLEQVYPLPDRITFQQGAALHVPYATAYRALFHRAKVKPNELVLIHGATGGVGIACVQWAVARGVRVIGTGGSERGRELVKNLGAELVLDHKSPNYLDELMKFTGGKGVDAIIEMLANVNLAKDLTILAKHGRVAVVGNRGTIEINPRDTMGKESAILGVQLWAGGQEAITEAHAAIVAGLKAGFLDPIIDHELPLSEAPRAHKEVIESRSLGKIVLIP
jgi:NADPH2:quinone reductase